MCESTSLLYGAEMRTVKVDSLSRRRGVHNRCIRSMLGLSRLQQWQERITSKELAETISMTHDEDLQKVSPQVARACT